MTEVNHSAAVASPCVRNCCLNEDDICLGCFRSVEEITTWNHASDDERLKILDRIRKRQQGTS